MPRIAAESDSVNAAYGLATWFIITASVAGLTVGGRPQHREPGEVRQIMNRITLAPPTLPNPPPETPITSPPNGPNRQLKARAASSPNTTPAEQSPDPEVHSCCTTEQ